MIPHLQQQTHHLQLHPTTALSSDHPMATRHRRGKLQSFSASDDDDDDSNGPRFKKGDGSSSSPWHRMKWTDEMVRLLITFVTCVGDDAVIESYPGCSVGTKRKPCGSSRSSIGRGGGGGGLQKKGKWKTVSKMMVEKKGFYVSPQQCEDKFNDLNKRYKRLNEILGRGTSCQVVANHSLLDSMAHVAPKSKYDVRKILSSKHLFYREMCAYHNGQRIPNSHETAAVPTPVGPSKDAAIQEEEEEGEKKEWFRKRTLQLQEEKVEIDAEGLEMEKQRFKWKRFCGKKDRELEKARLDNRRMALENQRMMMELKLKELELELELGLMKTSEVVVGVFHQ